MSNYTTKKEYERIKDIAVSVVVFIFKNGKFKRVITYEGLGYVRAVEFIKEKTKQGQLCIITEAEDKIMSDNPLDGHTWLL